MTCLNLAALEFTGCKWVPENANVKRFILYPTPHPHRCRMPIQALRFSHGDHRRGNALQAFFGKLLEGDLAYEAVHTYAAVSARKAVGRQGMVVAAGIVAYALGRIIADKDRACIDDARRYRIGLPATYDQV